MKSLSSWLALRAVKGLGVGTLSRLVLRLGSPEAVREASDQALMSEGGVSPSVAKRIREAPSPELRKQVQSELKALDQGRFSIMTIVDSMYPPRLAMIPDPPPLLYVTGELRESDRQALAIVGSRKCTPAGEAFTRQLSGDLAALGFSVVSGLARGIDAAAHQGALKVGGRTVAVLGCGINRTYPPEHQQLRQRIDSQGATLSEFPPGTPPRGSHFPQRNRVISGLCLGIIVTEAAEKSGSLITARLASEQNREVFAVPGSVSNAMSRGPHQLIKQGAKLVEGPSDILEELLPQLESPILDRVGNHSTPREPQSPSLSPEEQGLYSLISLEPISLEELLSQGALVAAEVLSILLSLEIKGYIKQLPGTQYIRTSIR